MSPKNCFMQARAGIDYESSFGKVRANDTILKLQRTTPYYKRNRAHVCSFFVRGQCTRGPECPYRHEMPVEGELSQQNIKDRYYGYVEGKNSYININCMGHAYECSTYLFHHLDSKESVSISYSF